jgi:NADH-quinone oxidoreductase subunit J
MKLDILLLVLFLLAAFWTVMTVRLLRSVIALAVTSIILTIIMFRLNAPLAAVFELSVCAGLISVIFVTTISFTERVSAARFLVRQKERWSKFWPLPLLLVLVGGGLILFVKAPLIPQLAAGQTIDARNVIWNLRQIDLVGQIAIILIGIFGTVIFFRGGEK